MDAAPERIRILGRLRAAGDTGIVRMEDRLDATVAEVWSALTDPAQLAHWYGEISGDLRLGGDYRARLHASGWVGTGHIDACEPRQRLLVTIRQLDPPDEGTLEVTLAADGDQTSVVWEERGMPAGLLAPYGAGIQVHVEDLAAHLGGRDRCDADVRWAELFPAYQEVVASSAGD